MTAVPKNRLSYSARKEMLTCGFKYERDYIWQSPQGSNSALILGNVVDDALSWADREQIGGKPRPGADVIVKYGVPLVHQKVALEEDRSRKPIEWKDDDTEDSLRKDTEAMIRAYEAYFAGRLHPKLSQEPFCLSFHGTDVQLTGRLDLYTEEGDLIDRKTSTKSLGEADVVTSDQLTFYQIPVEEKKLPVVRVGLHGLIRLQGGVKIQELYTEPRTQAVKDRALAGWLKTVRAIEAGEFAPADDWMTCSWCGYLQECHPEWYAMKMAKKAKKNGGGS